MVSNVLTAILYSLFPKVYAIDAQNPEPPTIPDILAQILPMVNTILFGLGPVLLVIMIVSAGIKRLMAADNAKAVQESNQTIFWSIVGYAVVLLSYAIVRLSATLLGYDITQNDDINL